MMPRKKKNGSRSDSPEKPLHVGFSTTPSSTSQYGSSDMGKWQDVPQSFPSVVPSHVHDKAEQDLRFHQLQDMFNGQVDADVVYVILSECDWKVEDAVEKLLELTNTLPPTRDTNQGPSLKTVASTITSSNTMASDQAPSSAPRQGLGLSLRSRLPSVQSSDPATGGLPMLSPRTPSVAGLDFPSFPQGTDKDDSIQIALDALDSYATPELNYMSSFQPPQSFDGSNMFDTQVTAPDSANKSFDSYGLHHSSSGGTGSFQQCALVDDMQQFPGMSALDNFSSRVNTCQNQDSVPYANLGGLNIYSQTFQPIQNVSPPVLPTTTYTTTSCTAQEPVSPRTAFNNVILGESALNSPSDIGLVRRPVREDSKDSATSDVSRVSDLSHASEESVVDLSPGLVPKRHHRQILRRQNISLDPQERESLEQLIEEVLIGGVDDGVMDSDDSLDSDEEEYDSRDGRRIKRLSRSEDGSKVTPSQLKVAAKHMKNLPPRFLKRLQESQPNNASGEEYLESENLENREPKLEEKKKSKRKGLLDSLGAYVEDDVPVTDPESEDGAAEPVESPGAAAPLSFQQAAGEASTQAGHAPASPTPQVVRPSHPHIILRPNVVNYSDLDPQRVIHTPPRMTQPQGSRPHSRDHTPEPRARAEQHMQQRFSLDAPEFVPRSFHPITPAAAQSISSPVSHLREGFTAAPAYGFSPRSGSPYTVHSGSPYPGGRSGSPYHLGLSSNLSPQMARRTLAGSPIAMVQVAPGRHSPIPPAFFIPKAPPNAAAAAAAAAMHGHPGLLQYPGYPVPHYPVHHPSIRYTVPAAGYRPPFMPPVSAPHRLSGHHAFKYSAKDRLQNSARPSSAPTLVPGTTSPRMAANLQPQTVSPDKKQPGGDGSKLDKHGKEVMNLSTQGSRSSKSSTDEDLSPQDRVRLILEKGVKLMVILRGVPGSGKTHLAKELVNSGVVLSTDDFFVTDAGYEFDYSRIGEAHEWNQKRAKQAIQDGTNPIIIDNTNTQAWEMKAYVLMSVKNDYHVEIMEPDTPWKFRAKELAKRNKHGVAKEFIQRMIDRYEHNVTMDTIVATSDKVKLEVEKRQRQAAQQEPANPDGKPPEERKTKKKTRRGKGRKKKARLRELREAEANKDSKEKTGDEVSSDEESTPEGDQSIDKSPGDAAQSEGGGQGISSPKLPSPDNGKDSPGQSQNPGSKPDSINPCSGSTEEKEDESTPEKSLSYSLSGLKEAHLAEVKAEDRVGIDDGNISDESDSSRDSVLSEPSTLESQLSQASDEEGPRESEVQDTTLLGSSAEDRQEVEDMMRDQQLLGLVMSSLHMNLKAMLQTKQGPAKAHLQTLLAKYQTSPEVRQEIEEIIKEKLFEGMVNKEVEQITGGTEPVRPEATEQEVHTKSLTATDVNSIMHVLGQITNVESDSNSSNNDSNNNQSQVDKPTEDSALDSDLGPTQSAEDTVSSSKRAGEVTLSSASSAKDLHAMEQAYWQADRSAPDPYTVGKVAIQPRTKSQTSWSDSSSEVAWENKPKARRERKRPYKKPKIPSDEFWNVSSDKQEENADSANSSLASSEPGTPKTPTTPEDGRRSRRLSGRNRIAAQFPMPELDPKDKEQLLMKDWQLPDFSSQQIPFSAPFHQVTRATLDAETYTHPKDFAVIHRLLQPQVSSPSQSAIRDEGFVGVRNAVARVIYEVAEDVEAVPTSTVPQRLMLHKSCSTRELEEEVRPDGLPFLKACFSTVADDDLSEILERCEGHVEWAANILLDAGYEYNESASRPIPPAPIVPTASPQVPAQPSQTPTQKTGPLELTQLCHQHLRPSQAFTPSVQEKFVETSVQRLNSISEFQRQRSSSSVTELQPQRSRDSASSLDLVPASPEADVFYSPLEGPLSPRSLFPGPLAPAPTVTPGRSGEDLVVGGSTPLPQVGGPGDGLALTLSPSIAQQLIALFGPVGFHISADSLAPEDLVVNLTRKTAKQLHRRWALTLQETFNSEENAIQQMIQQDEALAKQMQAEEDEKHQQHQQHQGGPRTPTHAAATDKPESLKEIMEEQMALELSKMEYEKACDDLGGGGQEHADSLATKMKRQKLWQMFPTVDRPTLEEVYKASGYNMTKTVSTIRASFGVDEPVQNVWTPEAVQAYEQMLLRQAVDLSLQEQWLGADDQEEEADPVQVLEDPQYQDLRAEASTHYRLRHECFQKAQEAHRRGLKAVACFYSQQGHLHTRKLREANHRAALKIVELRNQDVGQTNTIDLHGLHVDEALSILCELIAQRERELRQRPERRRDHLFVVTGRGSHSRGGKARIRPAVIDYLTRKHYSFSEAIPGSLKVLMKYRDESS